MGGITSQVVSCAALLVMGVIFGPQSRSVTPSIRPSEKAEPLLTKTSQCEGDRTRILVRKSGIYRDKLVVNGLLRFLDIVVPSPLPEKYWVVNR